jgi:hypothetical protein
MVEYTKVRKNRRKFLALTGLTPEEYEIILPTFSSAYEKLYPTNKTIAGKKRERQSGGGRRSNLSSIEQKLLFALIYQKTYPLQVVMGEMFGISQARANQWIHKLLPVLAKALDALGVLPERIPGEFADSERKQKEPKGPKVLIIDGTDRQRQRPKKAKKQRQHYSGKKKFHSDKNVIIVSANNRRAAYLSKTYSGKTHDKKIADSEAIAYPKQTILYKDTGFQGYEPYVLMSLQPKKSLATVN